MDTAITDRLANITNDYEAYSAFISANSEKAANLLGIFSAEKIGQNYKARSNIESEQANNFRVLSLVLMAFILITDLIYCFQGIFNGFNTSITSSVIAMSFLMYIPAIYLTKESNRHRKIQHANMQMSTDIDAVLTFISPLPELEQTRLKSALALVLITGRNNQEKTDEEGALLSQELVKQIIGSIKPDKNTSH